MDCMQNSTQNHKYNDIQSCSVSGGLCIDYWGPDEPNDDGDAEDCLEVWFDGSNLVGNDNRCDQTAWTWYVLCNAGMFNSFYFISSNLARSGKNFLMDKL